MSPKRHWSVLLCSAMWFLISILALVLSSCVFRRLRADVETFERQWSLIVNLDEVKGTRGDVVVVVYTPYDDGQRVAAYRVVDPAVGRGYFVLEPDDYRVAVFHDKNSNLTLDPGEPAVLAERGRRLKFSEVKKRIELSLPVPEEGTLPSGYPRELASLPRSLHEQYHVAYGDILNLEFGYVRNSDGDGTVDLNSVLVTEAQRDAVEIRAFEAGHVEVLTNVDVFEYAEDILLAAEERAAEAASAPPATCPCPETPPEEKDPESEPPPNPESSTEPPQQE